MGRRLNTDAGVLLFSTGLTMEIYHTIGKIKSVIQGTSKGQHNLTIYMPILPKLTALEEKYSKIDKTSALSTSLNFLDAQFFNIFCFLNERY